MEIVAHFSRDIVGMTFLNGTPMETVVGNFPMPIPKDMKTGSYKLWITVLDQASGNVLVTDDTVVSSGMNWIDLGMDIQIDDDAIETAKSLRVQALKTAEEGDCLQSWTEWKNATRHVYRNRRWKESLLHSRKKP